MEFTDWVCLDCVEVIRLSPQGEKSLLHCPLCVRRLHPYIPELYPVDDARARGVLLKAPPAERVHFGAEEVEAETLTRMLEDAIGVAVCYRGRMGDRYRRINRLQLSLLRAAWGHWVAGK